MKKVILVGASLNSGNRGVNALTRGQIMLMLDKYGEGIELEILSYTVNSEIINYINYNNAEKVVKEIPCTKKELIKAYIEYIIHVDNYMVNKLRSADIVLDISEGDSFSDIYGYKRFIQHSIIKLLTIKIKKRLIIMPQTLGPYKRKWVKRIAKYILVGADTVFVRDDLSKKIAEDDLKVKRKINYAPDMAFYMKADNKVSIENFIDNTNNIKIGINISALLYNGGYSGKNMFELQVDYKKLVYKLIEKFSEKDLTEIILIPHVMTEEFEIEDDFRVCKTIAKEINEKTNVKIKTINNYYREDELKAIISGCDFFIGSRMHACIGAISSCVPTVPIAYSRKFVGIWDKIGLGYCVTDPRKENESEIIDSILKNFNNREKIKAKLNLEIPKLKHQIEQIASVIEEQ